MLSLVSFGCQSSQWREALVIRFWHMNDECEKLKVTELECEELKVTELGCEAIYEVHRGGVENAK